MPKRYQNAIRFSPSKRRRVEAEFTGAEVTSNGGLPLLAEADRRLGLTRAAADAMGDDRRRKSVVHSTLSIVRQRVYALVLGHEDLNDHDGLRRDTALQAATGRDAALASPSTLCRFERRSSPSEALALHGVLFEQFVKAHPVPPDGFLKAGERHPVAHPVQAFHDLWTARTQAKHETAAGEVMQGECRHGGHGWRARGDLHDAGGEFDAFGLVRQIGEGGGGIAPPGFSGKSHVHT